MMRGGLTLALGMLLAAYSSLADAAESVCAVVKIEIQQELTLERQAFDAHMRINNGLETLSLENVDINVTFEDENGNAVLASSDPNNTDALFFIRVDQMDGIADISGAGTVAPASSADVHWIIIPAPGAGGSKPSGTLYFVGASLSYTLGGEPQSMTVTPDSIYVKPLPRLTLDYFLTKDVYADDAFTPEVEPPEPFTLGVRVRNNGAATAEDVTIDSAQPKIVENEQGLLIDFKIIGSSVNDQPATNSLLVNFGDIAPNAAAVGRWDMITTLSGQFTEFTATVSHADELGGQLTSLIDAANTHFLVHDVRVDVPGRDMVRDFLARDGDVLRVYESDSVDTGVTDQSAGSAMTENGTDGTYTFLRLTTPVTAGFMYVQLPDPYEGKRTIAYVQRNDGKRLPPSNAWFSKQRNADHSWSHFFNLFDANATGGYTIALDQQPLPPELQPLTAITTWETNPTTVTVTATDPNGTVPSLSAQGLPTGASFTDQGNGTGVLSWTPDVGQTGEHSVSFTASDGALKDTATLSIKVNPAWDSDGDGMDDDWEREHFGDLSRDGTGDFDGDGISDLQEFLAGYDPTLPPPSAPSGLGGEPGNEENTLSWPAADGAVSYNLYWSSAPDVTVASGQKVEGVTSGYVHTGLINETPYYYVLTVVGAGGESTASTAISVTPGIWDWNTPAKVESSDAGDAAQPAVALNGAGQGVAVWSQPDGTRTSIWANHFVARSGWGTPALLETDDLHDAAAPQVAIDGTGRALALWQQSDGTHANVVFAAYDPSSGWSSAAALDATDTDDAYAPRVAMNSAGRAVAIWTQGAGGTGSQVWAAEYVPGTGWSAPARIEARTATTALLTDLAIDANGNALVLWTEAGTNILANRLLAGSGWAGETVLRTGASGELRARAALDGAGNALAVWAESDGSANSIYADRYVAGSGWNGAEAIETAAGAAATPVASLNTVGAGAAVWQQNDGGMVRIFANRYVPGSGWTGALCIDGSERGDGATPQVGIDEKGNVLALWQQFDGVQQNVWAAAFDPEMGWAAAEVIDTENAGDAVSPQLALEAGGDALAVWLQSDGNHVNLWANDYLAGNAGMPNIAPIPVTAASLTVDEQTAVTLDGSGSFDQDGTATGYAWAQLDGPTVTLSGADTAVAGFPAPTLKTQAVLHFRLTVTDDEGAADSRDVTVTVNPVNHPPVVDAGAAQRIAENTVVTLTGTASDPDADGVLVSYAWTQTAGPRVSLQNADTLTPSFTAPAVYEDNSLGFQLTVTDDEGGVSTATTSVVVYSTNPDDDGDGMYDLWEVQYFGDLSRDGTQDFDGDGATDAQEFGFQSDPTVPQGPGEPEIDTPDGSEVTALQPVLKVLNAAHHPSFPVTYRFEVYRDAAMTQLVASAAGVPEAADGTAWTVDVPLADNTWHYWRVRAEGWVLQSAWVSSRFFVNTVNDPPGAFYISFPKDGSWVDSFTPTLSVTNSVDVDEDALTYAFEVYADAAMTQPVSSVTGVAPGPDGTTGWTVDPPLVENTWYWWHSVVTDEHGLSTASDSGRFFVNTRNDAPGAPVLQSPPDGSEVPALSANLVVKNGVDPEAEPLVYDFEIDTVNTFDSPAKQVSPAIPEQPDTTAWTAVGLADNSWHYWRAKASDGRADSAWVQGRFFANTVNDPPGIPTPLNPGDNSWVGTLQPTLEVHPAVDIDEDVLHYEFEVYSANRWGLIYAKVAEGGSPTTSWQLAQPLPESGWYYWRARAIDEHGLAGDWAQPVIFYADEDGVNDPPYIRLKKLKYDKGGKAGHEHHERGGEGEKGDGHELSASASPVEVRWKDRDPDSNAHIRLYYDDNNWGTDGTLIAGGIMEDPDGRRNGDVYRWDTAALPPGVYYVYAVIDDGNSQAVSYSPNVVVVGDGGTGPFLQFEKPRERERVNRRAEIRWQDRDSDSNATISLYYDTDAAGADGTLIVSGLPEAPDGGRADRFVWDVSAVPEGEYHIYAVVTDGVNTFIGYSPGTVVVAHSEHHHDEGRESHPRR